MVLTYSASHLLAFVLLEWTRFTTLLEFAVPACHLYPPTTIDLQIALRGLVIPTAKLNHRGHARQRK